jgi:hypothetical protein
MVNKLCICWSEKLCSFKLSKIPLFGSSLIHQLQFLGSQQQSQSGIPLISFSAWGTENSLAEANLEITGNGIGM